MLSVTHVFEKLMFWLMAYSCSETILHWPIVGCSVVLSWSHGLSQHCVGVGYALRVFPVVTRLMVHRWPQVCTCAQLHNCTYANVRNVQTCKDHICNLSYIHTRAHSHMYTRPISLFKFISRHASLHLLVQHAQWAVQWTAQVGRHLAHMPARSVLL